MSPIAEPLAFRKLVAESFDDAQARQIEQALRRAEKAHHGQKRGTGEPYVYHSIAVATILMDWRLDAEVIVAALLHDVPEDTAVSLAEVEAEFGADIAHLVESVTKLSRIRLPAEDIDYEIENLRRLFLAMAEDVRVVLLKLADRLHNIRTIEGVSADKQARIGRETVEIYAPLADRLGMGEVRGELDDRGFRAADPGEYAWVKKQIEQRYNQSAEYMSEVKRTFEATLSAEGIDATVSSRTKNLHSLYKKLLDKERDIDRVYDFFAVRVVVPTVEDCYQSMGVVHQHWQPLPHRIKDYIAVPKMNGYRSLHTTIFGPGKHMLEVQIRTEQMHHEAEWGVAAHAVYADNKQSRLASTEQLQLMKQLASWQEELKGPGHVLDRVKLDMFADRIFVFTPKGAPFSLPAGANPVDFAYIVHTEVGHMCHGAKVNGVIVPLDSPLSNGDIVEILTKKNSEPKRDWLKFVRTGHARSAIKSYFRKEDRDIHVRKGREELDNALKKHNLHLSKLTKDQQARVAETLHVKEFEDALASLGETGGSVTSVLRVLGLEQVGERKAKPPVTKDAAISGLHSLLTKRALCCKPQPPQGIIGYVTLGKGISIHRDSCPQVPNLPDPSRLISVSWE